MFLEGLLILGRKGRGEEKRDQFCKAARGESGVRGDAVDCEGGDVDAGEDGVEGGARLEGFGGVDVGPGCN